MVSTPRTGSAVVPTTGRRVPQPGSDPLLDVDECE